MGRRPLTRNPTTAEAVALRAFGTRVREARHARGLSQEKLAFATGLHFTYVSDVEQGRRNVSLLTLVRLADGLGVPPPALVDGLGRCKLVVAAE